MRRTISQSFPRSSVICRRLLVMSIALTVVALGLILRLEAAQQTVVDDPVRADARDYVLYAFNMKAFGVYSRSISGLEDDPSIPKPDSVRPPMYPLMLASLVSLPLTDQFLRPILYAQVVLGMVTVLLTLFVGYRLAGTWGGIVAAALTAISPHLVSMETYLLTETLFTVLLLASVALLLLAMRAAVPRQLWLYAVAAGFFLALSALTRSTSLYLLPFLLVFALARRPSWRSLVVGSLIGFALGYSPWLIRNAVSVPEPSNLLAENFLQYGMYPGMMYDDIPQSYGAPYRFDPNNEAIGESMSSVIAEIARRVSEEPMRHLAWYAVGKPLMFWQWDIVAGQGDVFVYWVKSTPYFENGFHLATHSLMRVLHVPLLLAAALYAGVLLVRLLRSPSSKAICAGDEALLVSLVLLYATLLHMVGAPFSRYSIPFRPELHVLAVAGVAAILGKALNFRARTRLRAGTPRFNN